MRGLTREERHQWVGQPGHWVCKRCRAVVQGSDALDDGLCVASLSGQLDYAPALRASDLSHSATLRALQGVEDARPTRLDTPERVDKVPRQGRVGDLFRSTGKGRQEAPEQGGKQ